MHIGWSVASSEDSVYTCMLMYRLFSAALLQCFMPGCNEF